MNEMQEKFNMVLLWRHGEARIIRDACLAYKNNYFEAKHTLQALLASHSEEYRNRILQAVEEGYKKI